MIKRLFAALVFLLLSEGTAICGDGISAEKLEKLLLSRRWSIEDSESESDRKERAKVLSKALTDAVDEINPKMSKKLLVGAAVAIWWYESRLGRTVHGGGLSRYGSDDGKAKCLGQIHARSVGLQREEGEPLEAFRARQKAAWEALAGLDYESTKRCAIATMRRYRSMLFLCRSSKSPWIAAYGAYGSGDTSCAPLPTSERRYRMMERIAASL